MLQSVRHRTGLDTQPCQASTIGQYKCEAEELTSFLKQTLDKGCLGKHEAERLRGRLQFASNQLFGRRFRNCLRDLNIHISRGFKILTPEMIASFRVLQILLEENRPRAVDVNFFERRHMYVDFSFCAEGHSGLGGLLLDERGNCLRFFSEEVPSSFVSSIKREEQDTIIFELEGLAIAIGLHLFSDFLKGRHLVVFTDNQAAQACLIKCKSDNDHMDLIIRSTCTAEEKLDLMSWVERVPSQSNPADELSRTVSEDYMGCTRTCVDVHTMWHRCLEEQRWRLQCLGDWREGVKRYRTNPVIRKKWERVVLHRTTSKFRHVFQFRLHTTQFKAAITDQISSLEVCVTLFSAFYLGNILTFFLWHILGPVSGILSDNIRLNECWLHSERGTE